MKVRRKRDGHVIGGWAAGTSPSGLQLHDQCLILLSAVLGFLQRMSSGGIWRAADYFFIVQSTRAMLTRTV